MVNRLVLGITLLALAACGGGGSPTLTPTPTPTPVPQPTPTPVPTPSPCEHGSCGNNTAVARATIRIYMMFDENGEPVAVPDPTKGVVSEAIPVGYRFRLDVTGRDTNGHETDGRGQITWHYSGQDLVDIDARTPWQHDFTVTRPGPWTVYVVFDGVGSNDLVFTFRAR